MEISPQEFALAIMIGGALLALWFLVRFPNVGPSRLWIAAGHVVLAFTLGRAFVEVVPDVFRGLPVPNALVLAIVLGTVPPATYLFLSLAWFLRNIQRLAGSFL